MYILYAYRYSIIELKLQSVCLSVSTSKAIEPFMQNELVTYVASCFTVFQYIFAEKENKSDVNCIN